MHPRLIVIFLEICFTAILSANRMEETIYISFINCNDVDKEQIISEVNKVYTYKVSYIYTPVDIELAYNSLRKQYSAEKILTQLNKLLPDDAKVLVTVIDKDLYTEGFNYIFGQAWGKVSIVSIYRFKPCTQVDSLQEKNLLTERTIKTIIHEIGHCIGLPHCSNPKCVMYFSNWVGDTDRKSMNFCNKCKNKLYKIDR